MFETELIPAIWGAVKGYVIAFTLFTAIAFILKGRGAFDWSLELLQSVRTNLALSLINPWVAPLIMTGVVLLRMAYDAIGLPQTPLSFWDTLPVWMVVIAWLVTIDFIDYWNHRLLHAPGFWAIHAVHHSETEMNWTTSSRIHVLEVVVMQISYILLATWMNIPAEGVGAVVAFRLLHNNWVHTRHDFSLGWFDKIIATPRFHHWHHADTPQAYNTNFANTFSLWDVMFGTYRVPGPYRGVYGFEGNPGNDLVQLLIWPYKIWATAVATHVQRNRTKKEQMIDAA